MKGFMRHLGLQIAHIVIIILIITQGNLQKKPRQILRIWKTSK